MEKEKGILELISFLQTWKFWPEVKIVAAGIEYAHSYKKEDTYKGLRNILVHKPSIIEGMVEKNEFSIFYENSALADLLYFNEYCPDCEESIEELENVKESMKEQLTEEFYRLIQQCENTL